MRFYDREAELAALSEIARLSSSTAHMVVISGRRRVGKTELIRNFSKDRKNVLYFFVSRKNLGAWQNGASCAQEKGASFGSRPGSVILREEGGSAGIPYAS